MSSSNTTDVFEAELMDSNAVNPFASPGVKTAADPNPQIGPGIGRASERQIRFVIQSMFASEITYFILWCAWLASMIWGTELTVLILIGVTLVAWCCFAVMVISHGEFDLTSLGMILSFPIPLFGLVIFFAGRMQACRFLTWNGYRPGILGASPDHEEIAFMNADPNYRPSAWYDRNGVKRKMIMSLNHGLVAAVVFVGIAAVVTAALRESSVH